MRKFLLLLIGTVVMLSVSLVIGLEFAAAQESEALTAVDVKVMKELTGVKETPDIVFHYRPGDMDDKQLDEVVKTNMNRFAECKKLLKMDYQGRVHIFLYKDMEDMQKTTGADGAAAFATGTVSVHQPMDFDSVHELVHIFALQFPKDENETTDMFVTEGLATILAFSDEGVPIQSWAAVIKSAGKLPELIPFRKVWPEGSPRGVHPYYVPASFMGYLIDQYGIEKVKRWYVNCTEAHMFFGKTLRHLERDWHTWLNSQVVELKHRNHVLQKLGLLPIPESYLSAKGTSLFDGVSMDGLSPDDPAIWEVKDGLLVGTNPGEWTRLKTEVEFDANIGVRMKFRLVEGNAVQVRLNCSGDSDNHVNLAHWAIFMSLKNGGFQSGWDDTKISHGDWNEIVLVNDNGTGRLYLNGFLAVEVKEQFRLQKGAIGIGVESGTIEVEEFVAFEK